MEPSPSCLRTYQSSEHSIIFVEDRFANQLFPFVFLAQHDGAALFLYEVCNSLIFNFLEPLLLSLILFHS